MATTPEAQALLERWRTEKDFTARDELLDELVENGIFPGKDQEEWETQGGLYPGLDDPMFLPKLMQKREFQESKQISIADQMAELRAQGKEDKCRSSEDFELTPVQRFVNRLLSPRTPYRSALLYHGVGVGKTCAAVTVAESYLKEYPGKKVYIVAPPNIQEGFKRTIFDSRDGLTIAPKGSQQNNQHRGCTGDVYLELTGSFKEPNRSTIESRVGKAIKSRYEFFGYTSFYNHIVTTMSSVAKSVSADKAEEYKRQALRHEFSDRVLIIDEAHNLRDNPLEADDDSADDATPGDSADSKAGKKLTPFLKEVLEVCEGITLVLMTATPMYNSYAEIVFLLNLLLTNDKFAKLRLEDIFDIKSQTFQPGGEIILGKIASHYISFMRGENPLTFPLRLQPAATTRVRRWPGRSPKGDPINAAERQQCAQLPCIGAYFAKETEEMYKTNAKSIVTSPEGMGITNMDILIQAGNWIFPGNEDDDFLDRIRQQGFENTFVKEKRGSTVSFRCIDDEVGASWLLDVNLPKASGKCATLLKRLNNCHGVAFVYSRFVASGALTIAMALEANGYTAWGRDSGFLADGNQHPDGRQCALCPRKERGHGTVARDEAADIPEHGFKPAKYILLTGSEELSPNNARAVEAARAPSNINGEDIKVIIGSQIAAEGLDFRYVREEFVFDSWYHLNKLEQIIGRGIRNCSHAALPATKKNCTVTLLVNQFATEPDTETIDLYSYRLALKKAIVVGNVTRVLKEYALDCSLNREAIIVAGLDPLPLVIDSQGGRRENVPINDVPLTPMCDWLETCEYDCKYGDDMPMVTDIPLEEQDSSTYDEYTARFQLNKLRTYLQDRIVRGTPFVTFERIENDFSSIPRPLLGALLNEITEQKEFRITTPQGSGRIIYKNGYYIFQPDKLKDTSIPVALRLANIPIPRDRFTPVLEEVAAVGTAAEGAPGTAAAAPVADEDSEGVWEESKAWCEALASGEAAMDEIPAGLLAEIAKLRESSGLMKTQKERLDMILWLYSHIQEDDATRAVFAEAVLEYMWDEFLTVGTKRELLSRDWADASIQNVAKDAFWEMEGNLYLRLMNGMTNQIEYICVDAAAGTSAPCPRAIVEVLEREKELDPLLKRSIDVRYTGFEYGFINFNPKKQRLVFKKGKPPMPRGKLGRGSECSINSGTTYELTLLERFGKMLRDAGKNDLGLNERNLGDRKRIANSVRVCTVSDLALRYMDKVKLQGKRWFYRALESKLHGHPLR
jgi:hypothetical protein